MLKESLEHSKLAGPKSFDTYLTRSNCNVKLSFGNFVELPTQNSSWITTDVAAYILSSVCLYNCICEAAFSSPPVWPTPEYKLVFSSSSTPPAFHQQTKFIASSSPNEATLELLFHYQT